MSGFDWGAAGRFFTENLPGVGGLFRAYNMANDAGNAIGAQSAVHPAVAAASGAANQGIAANAARPVLNTLATNQLAQAAGKVGGGLQSLATQPQPRPFTPAASMDIVGPNYGRLQQQSESRQKYLGDLMRRRQAEVDGLLGTIKPNPYQQGGTAYTSAMNGALSRPSGLLQNALANTQRTMAEQGITADSGLTQQALNQNRLEAAKMAAQYGGQVDQDFANKAAGYDQWRAQFEAQQRANLGDFQAQMQNALSADDFGTFDRLARGEEAQYGRRLDSQLDPYRVQEAQQGVQRGALQNLSQQLQNDAAGMQNGTYRQLMPSEIAARQAQNRLSSLDAGYMADETQRQGEMMASPYGDYIRGFQAIQNDPMNRSVKGLISDTQQAVLPFLGMGLSGGGPLASYRDKTSYGTSGLKSR